jgi:hypothetical protein
VRKQTENHAQKHGLLLDLTDYKKKKEQEEEKDRL